MKIGIDIDGVLLDTIPAFLELVNKDKGTAFTKADITEYHFGDIIGISDDEMWEYFKKVDNSKLPLCDPQAKSWIDFLRKRGQEIIVITCNEEPRATQLRDRLRALEIQMDNFIAIGPNVSKLETIREYNVDYMIDDSIRNLDQVSTDCFPIMYAQPWNTQTNRFLRVKDFYGIVDIIHCKERLKKYEVK